MSEEFLKEGDTLLDDIIRINLLNENNFLDLVETTLPFVTNPKRATQQFRVFRNTIASKPAKYTQPIAKLERTNEIVVQHAQNSRLIKVQNENFAIREKVDNLQRDLLNFQNSLELKIETTSSDVETKLDDLSSKLDAMDEKLTSILTILNNIDTLKDDIIAEIKKIIDYLKISIEKPLTDVKTQLDTAVETLNTLGGKIDRLLTGQDEILLAIGPFIPPNSIFASIERLLTGQNEIIGGLGAILAALTGEAIDPKNIKPALDNFKNKIKEAIKEWFEDTDEEIYKNSSDYICDKIVGESYIKYDGSSLYMPTLIFKYKNKTIVDKRKYAQIKIRLNLANDDITDKVVNDLRQQIIQLSDFSYFSGNLRCLYVSQNRLFKTTVFCSDKKDAISLFQKLIPISKTSFLENNFSFTENSKREHFQRKKQPLKNTNLNPSLKAYKSEMMLSSVFLQINGLDRQIKLY